jgi:hypothetical protein
MLEEEFNLLREVGMVKVGIELKIYLIKEPSKDRASL